MKRKTTTLSLITAALLATAGVAQAQQTIDHNKALAGGITAGDTPGYPITITRPGHYKLVGNLSVPANTNGIEVAADDVTIDMNGFTLAGPANCARNNQTRVVTCTAGGGIGNGTGIDSSFNGSFNGFVVRDGTVRGFGKGIRGVQGETLLRMHITQNESYGVTTASAFAGMAIFDSIVDLNGSTGVAVSNGLIRGSRVGHNGNNGIQTSNMIVEGSFVLGNRNIGMQSGAGHVAAGQWHEPRQRAVARRQYRQLGDVLSVHKAGLHPTQSAWCPHGRTGAGPETAQRAAHGGRCAARGRPAATFPQRVRRACESTDPNRSLTVRRGPLRPGRTH